MSKPNVVAPARVPCGFTCIIDTREQLPYQFDSLWDGPAGRSNLIEVPVVRQCLTTGDYSVLGFPGIAIERKSKSDLYGSISQARENFEGRLIRMHESVDFPVILVEAEWAELLTAPPEFTKFSPKSLTRTILAWMVRYDRVRWLMAPSRAHAEAFAFRLMDRYVKECADVDRACQGRPVRPGDLAGAATANDGAYARPGPAEMTTAVTGEARPPEAKPRSRPKAKESPPGDPGPVQGELLPEMTTGATAARATRAE